MPIGSPIILLTGASGFVGRAVCSKALHCGFEVRGTVRRNERLTAKNVAVEIGEINSTSMWQASLQGITTIIHLAARVHVMQDTTADPIAAFREVNVGGTLNLARQAASAGVRRFVFVSSAKVNGESTQPNRPFTEADIPNPQDAYSLSKYEAEQGLRQISADTGMEVVIIRPPLVDRKSVV